MAYLVSPCCGYEYSETIDDEGYEVYICENPKCKEEFPEPLEDYEFTIRVYKIRCVSNWSYLTTFII